MPANRKSSSVTAAALPAEALQAPFAPMRLPIAPPYPPMEARSAEHLPESGHWIYEPKWDGFRCLAFRDGDLIQLQSKAGQPLGRYFPEILEALAALPAPRLVLDGEITIVRGKHLDFDALLQRIHPAQSRIRRLAAETPATFLVFDLLLDGREDLTALPLTQRRERLERFAASCQGNRRIRLSPGSTELSHARRWLQEGAFSGLDGVIAKLAGQPYLSGRRTGMVKVKRIRTADCVVGGFRYAQKGGAIGSLLLGLYNDAGELDHVGFSSSFTAEQKQELKNVLKPLMGGTGFTGKAPGGPSRWARDDRNTEWHPLKPELVCEVRYDHFSGGRFRHGTKFVRWRPDKKPRQCTIEQVRPAAGPGMEKLLAA